MEGDQPRTVNGFVGPPIRLLNALAKQQGSTLSGYAAGMAPMRHANMDAKNTGTVSNDQLWKAQTAVLSLLSARTARLVNAEVATEFRDVAHSDATVPLADLSVRAVSRANAENTPAIKSVLSLPVGQPPTIHHCDSCDLNRARLLEMQHMYSGVVHGRSELAIQAAHQAESGARASECYEEAVRQCQARVQQLETALAVGDTANGKLVDDLRARLRSTEHQLNQAEEGRMKLEHALQDEQIREADLRKRLMTAGQRETVMRAELVECQMSIQSAYSLRPAEPISQHSAACIDHIAAASAEIAKLTRDCCASDAVVVRLREALHNEQLARASETAAAGAAAARQISEYSELHRIHQDCAMHSNKLRELLDAAEARNILLVNQARDMEHTCSQLKHSSDLRIAAVEADARQDREISAAAALHQQQLIGSLTLLQARAEAAESEVKMRGDALASLGNELGQQAHQAWNDIEESRRGESERTQAAVQAALQTIQTEVSSLRERLAATQRDALVAQANAEHNLDMGRHECRQLIEVHSASIEVLKKQHEAEVNALHTHLSLAQGRAVAEADLRSQRALEAAEQYRYRLDNAEAELASTRSIVAVHRAELASQASARQDDAEKVQVILRESLSSCTKADNRLHAAVDENRSQHVELQRLQMREATLMQKCSRVTDEASIARRQAEQLKRILGDTKAQVAEYESALAASNLRHSEQEAALKVMDEDSRRMSADFNTFQVSQLALLAAERQEVKQLGETIAELHCQLTNSTALSSAEKARGDRLLADSTRREHVLTEEIATALAASECSVHDAQIAQREAQSSREELKRLRESLIAEDARSRRLVDSEADCRRQLEIASSRCASAELNAESNLHRYEQLLRERTTWASAEIKLREQLSCSDSRISALEIDLARACEEGLRRLSETQRLAELLDTECRHSQSANVKAMQLAGIVVDSKGDAEQLIIQAQRDRAQCVAFEQQANDASRRANAAEQRADAEVGSRRAADVNAVRADHELSALRKQMSSKDAELDRIAKELGTLKAELKKAATEIEDSRHQISDAQRALSIAESASSAATADCDRLRDELTKLRNARDGLISELTQNRSELARSRALVTAMQNGNQLQAQLDTSLQALPSVQLVARALSPGASRARRVSSALGVATPPKGGHITMGRQLSVLQEQLLRSEAALAASLTAADTLRGKLTAAIVLTGRLEEELRVSRCEVADLRDAFASNHAAEASATQPRASDHKSEVIDSLPLTVQASKYAMLEQDLARATLHIQELTAALDKAQVLANAAERRAEENSHAQQQQVAALHEDILAVRMACSQAVLQAEAKALDACTATEAELDAAVARTEERVAEAVRTAERRAENTVKQHAECAATLSARAVQLTHSQNMVTEYARFVSRLSHVLGLSKGMAESGNSDGDVSMHRTLDALLKAAVLSQSQGPPARVPFGSSRTTSTLLSYAAPLSEPAIQVGEQGYSSVRRGQGIQSPSIAR